MSYAGVKLTLPVGRAHETDFLHNAVDRFVQTVEWQHPLVMLRGGAMLNYRLPLVRQERHEYDGAGES